MSTKKKAGSSSAQVPKVPAAASVELVGEDWDGTKANLFDCQITKKVMVRLLDKRILKPKERFSVLIFGKNEQFLLDGFTLKNGKIEEGSEGIQVVAGTQISFESVSEASKEPTVQEQKSKATAPRFFDFGFHRKKLFQLAEFYLLGDTLPFIRIGGVLVSGDKGSGKSTLMKELTAYCHAKATVLGFTGKGFAASKHLDREFLKARQPFLVCLDDLEGTKEVVSKLNDLFVECEGLAGMVVAACRSENTQGLEGLLGPGKFESEVEIESLSKDEREALFGFFIHGLLVVRSEAEELIGSDEPKGAIRSLQALKEKDMAEIVALRTSGFSVYDIQCLVREIELLLFSTYFSKTQEKKVDDVPSSSSQLPSEPRGSIPPALLPKDLVRQAFVNLGARSLKEFSTKIDKVLFSQIGGYESVKARIKAVVELPLKNPGLFVEKGIRPSKGILLFGPPGCSKTMFAKAVATESNLNFISVKGPEIFNKYVGSSEKKVRELFKKARFCSPCVIFFDEIDAIAGKRDKKNEVGERVLTQLLTEIDGVEEPVVAKKSQQGLGDKEQLPDFGSGLVIVIGATNRPESLDPAILRPGRFDELVYVPLPDREARQSILVLSTKAMPLESDVDIQDVCLRTEGYSGAEIVQLCREAAMQSIHRETGAEKSSVSRKDFDSAFTKVHKRTSLELLKRFEKFERNDAF
jgi:SpoVK/Ycf46/Vps4 family AAA+-type ATPase